MGRLLQEALSMLTCGVCHATESREELVDEVFQVDGKYVLIARIPAGGNAKPAKGVDMIRPPCSRPPCVAGNSDPGRR